MCTVQRAETGRSIWDKLDVQNWSFPKKKSEPSEQFRNYCLLEWKTLWLKRPPWSVHWFHFPSPPLLINHLGAKEKLFKLNYFLNWVIIRHTHIWNRFLFHQRPWHQLNSIYVPTYSPSCKQMAFRSLDTCTRSTHRTVRDFLIVRTLCVRHILSTAKLSQSVVEVVTSSLSNPNPLWHILGQVWAWVWVQADI